MRLGLAVSVFYYVIYHEQLLTAKSMPACNFLCVFFLNTVLKHVDMFALLEMKKYRVICLSTCICTYTSVHVHDNAQIVTDVKAVKAETGATSNTPGSFQSLVKEDRFIYNGHMLVDIKSSHRLTLPLFQPSTGNTPTKMIEQQVQ